jgi:hypothetical protein
MNNDNPEQTQDAMRNKPPNDGRPPRKTAAETFAAI